MARQKEVKITAPDMQVVEFLIEGTAPYVQHRFGEKAKNELHDKHDEEGESEGSEGLSGLFSPGDPPVA